MRRLALTLVWLAPGCSGGTEPNPLCRSMASRSDSSRPEHRRTRRRADHRPRRHVAAGSLRWARSRCRRWYVHRLYHCLMQMGNGSMRFELAHTYTTGSGDTFTTTDRVVARRQTAGGIFVNNQVDVTGGTGQFGRCVWVPSHARDGDLQTGVVSSTITVAFHALRPCARRIGGVQPARLGLWHRRSRSVPPNKRLQLTAHVGYLIFHQCRCSLGAIR